MAKVQSSIRTGTSGRSRAAIQSSIACASCSSSQSSTVTDRCRSSSTSSPARPWSASASSRPGPSVSLVSSTVDICNLLCGRELGLLGRAPERKRGAFAARDGLEHAVEVAGADLALVAGRGVAVLLERELAFLQLDVGGHALGGVAAGELEHAGVQRVEAGEGDELVAVAELGERLAEGGDLGIVEVLPPVERR